MLYLTLTLLKQPTLSLIGIALSNSNINYYIYPMFKAFPLNFTFTQKSP